MASVHRDLRRSPISVTTFLVMAPCGSSPVMGTGESAMKSLKQKLMIAGMTASYVGLLFQMTVRTSPAQPNDEALIAKAKGIHDRVLKLDTHNDIEPANFTADCNYTMRLTTQVNLPKMIEGDMDVSFMIVFVGQGQLTPEGFDDAYQQAVAKFDAIHRLTEK